MPWPIICSSSCCAIAQNSEVGCLIWKKFGSVFFINTAHSTTIIPGFLKSRSFKSNQIKLAVLESFRKCNSSSRTSHSLTNPTKVLPKTWATKNQSTLTPLYFLASTRSLLNDSCTILFSEGVIIESQIGIASNLKKCGFVYHNFFKRLNA